MDNYLAVKPNPVVDPEFPVKGDVDPLGDVNLRRRPFSVKMYAKMKELGPVGGVPGARPLDPPM